MGNIKTISVSQTKHHMKSIFLKISIMAAIFVISSSFVIDHMNPAEENLNCEFCDQIIKYSTDTVKGPNGEELLALTEITINPLTNIITLESFTKDQGKVLFDTQIESTECSLTEKPTSGKADYIGYIIHKDGSKSQTEIVLEAKNGVVSLTTYNGEKQLGLRATFRKWEIMKNIE